MYPKRKSILFPFYVLVTEHQADLSNSGGKACLSPTGPKCYAKLGYANITSAVPGFYNDCGGSGACEFGTFSTFNATIYETKLAGKILS